MPIGKGNVFIENNPTVITYLHDIAEGNIANHFHMNKFGYNPTVGATEEDIWDGSAAYVYLTSAEQLKVSSSDVNDDGSPAGTGARTLEIFGLDGNYDLQDEVLTLNGTTAVTTVGSYLRIFRAKVITAGTGDKNAGIIYVENNAETNTLAHIPIGLNQTQMALWTVPAGYTAYLVSFYGSTGLSKVTEILLYIRPFGEVFQVKNHFHIVEDVYQHNYILPISIPEKSDIAVRASVGVAGGAVAAGFDLYYKS